MKALILLFALLLLFPSQCQAARTVSISSGTTSLFGEQEAEIISSASGFTEGELIYIKGAFYKEGSTNYFGYTKNNDSWIKNGETTTSQRQVKIGEWDGKLLAKSDFSDSGYQGEGEYRLKVGFYYLTSSGNPSSVNWSSNSVLLSISEPDPTETPTPSPLPETNSPEPSLRPSVTSQITITSPILLSKSVSLRPTKKPMKSLVLAQASKDVENKETIKEENQLKYIPGILILLGSIFIITCGILVYRKRRKEQR